LVYRSFAQELNDESKLKANKHVPAERIGSSAVVLKRASHVLDHHAGFLGSQAKADILLRGVGFDGVRPR
jgi:hypothetical protein